MTMHLVVLEQLDLFARHFSRELKSGDVVCLTGEMGAGKTTFLGSVLQEMGFTVSDGFASPTFTILNQYRFGQWLVHHVDLYRLEAWSSLEQLDIIGLFGAPGTITFVEWGDKFAELKPLYTKSVSFSFDDITSDVRHVMLTSL